MAARVPIIASALLLAGSLLWGRCVSCRTLASQQPVHDCCHKGGCHRDGSPQAAPEKCPHQAVALEQYAKVDPAPPAVSVAATLLVTDPAPAPERARRPAAAPLLVHSPPDLFLRNSALLI